MLDRLSAGEGREGLTPWDADLAPLLAGRRDPRADPGRTHRGGRRKPDAAEAPSTALTGGGVG
jgi:hypothetical protein